MNKITKQQITPEQFEEAENLLKRGKEASIYMIEKAPDNEELDSWYDRRFSYRDSYYNGEITEVEYDTLKKALGKAPGTYWFKSREAWIATLYYLAVCILKDEKYFQDMVLHEDAHYDEAIKNGLIAQYGFHITTKGKEIEKKKLCIVPAVNSYLPEGRKESIKISKHLDKVIALAPHQPSKGDMRVAQI